MDSEAGAATVHALVGLASATVLVLVNFVLLVAVLVLVAALMGTSVGG